MKAKSLVGQLVRLGEAIGIVLAARHGYCTVQWLPLNKTVNTNPFEYHSRSVQDWRERFLQYEKTI